MYRIVWQIGPLDIGRVRRDDLLADGISAARRM